MNLIKETKERLDYHKEKIESLDSALGEDLSQDARLYIASEAQKALKNIKYYSELLEVLEKDKEDKK